MKSRDAAEPFGPVERQQGGAREWFRNLGRSALDSAESARVNWGVFALVAVATMLQGTGDFYYDADHYWTATLGVLGLADVPPHYWDLRGIFSAVIYMPAALLTGLLGQPFGAFSVLTQNSLLLAWLAAFLIPRFTKGFIPTSPRVLLLGGFLTWAVCRGFAPYPLMDVYSAVGMIIVIILLREHGRPLLLLAGGITGIVINLRPAYIVVVLMLLVVTMVWRRWLSLLFLAGTMLTLLPQVAANVARVGQWDILPVGSGGLVALQSSYAAYVVRYDTILGAGSARQFYCSPDMADLIKASPPESAGALLAAFLDNVPISILFAIQKISAAIHWPLMNPYANPVRGVDALFGTSVVVVCVVGIAGLLYLLARQRRGAQATRFDIVVVSVVAAGSAVTLISSATEARFALLLVLLGVAGVSSLAGTSFAELRSTRLRWWVLATSLIALLVLVQGKVGLDSPAPRGDVSPVLCEFAQSPDVLQINGVQE